MTKKITELPTASSLSTSDLLPVVHDPSGSPVTQRATIAQVLALGAAGLAPGWVSVAQHGAVGDCEDNDPTTGTNDSPAFAAALAAALEANAPGILIPPLAPGFSYRLDTPVEVTWPAQIIGMSGAREGKGFVKLTLKAGIEGAFVFRSGTAARGNIGADGAHLEGVHITCTPTITTRAYATATAYALGEHVHSSLYNRTIHKCIKAGTTDGTTEAAFEAAYAPHFPDRSAPWQALETVYWGDARRGSDSNHWNVLFYVTTPGAPGSSGETGATEPVWNYTPGATTVDGDVTWTCFDDPTVWQVGTAWFTTVVMGGVYIVCPMTVRDVRIDNPQGFGISVIGNNSIPGPGSNTNRFNIEDVIIKCAPGAHKSGGVWCRGGELRFGTGRNIHVIGSLSSGQGNTAMPGDGTDLEHGIHDETFLGGNTWTNCTAQFCGGYDFAGTGGNNAASFVNCVSDGGRVRLDAALWVGPYGGKFWSAYGFGYAASTTSMGDGGLLNANESHGTVKAGLNAAGLCHYIQDSTDGGAMGWRYDGGGWMTHSHASIIYPALAVSNGQVPNDGSLPNGETLGALRLPRGFAIGGADYVWEFASPAMFRSDLRGGYRRVGDVIRRPDAVAVGGYEREVVVAAGYTGPTWTAATAKGARVAPVSLYAQLGSIVIPSNTANKNAFMCTVAGTTHATTEPTWSSAPNLNDTLTDGTVTWKNVGPQPKLAGVGLVDYTAVADVSTTGNIDNLSTEGVKEIRLTGAAPVVRGLAHGTPGRVVILTAIGGNVVLAHENANSSVTNRLDLPASTATIAQKTSVALRYDGTSQRWREFSALART